MPEEATTRLIQALEKIWNADEFKGFMSQRGFGTEFAAGEAFATFMAESDRKLGAVMQEIGLAQGQ